jgi:type IV pilus assembly protein PilE
MKWCQGFSLLELMVVVAIVAILMAIGYPPYSHYLVKARRSQAEVNLLYMAGQMEAFYSLNSTYQGASSESLGLKLYTDDQSYQLSIQTVSDSHYTLAATPLGAQTQADTDCKTLTLSETGERGSTGDLPANFCWS